ncbi:hypothetical protein FORC64_1302 [Escherichia coli]|nr:hypothetical protein FORC64_1302 [Escherichia coli]
MLLVFRRVGWGGFNFSWLHDKTSKALVGDESATAVDVLALVVALFRFSAQVPA